MTQELLQGWHLLLEIIILGAGNSIKSRATYAHIQLKDSDEPKEREKLN